MARSILKEPKIYFFDNGLVIGDDGAKFENFTALSLLKHVYGKNDYTGDQYELKYFRTKDGKEVDFAIIKNNKIQKIIEAKKSDKQLSKNLKFFADKYKLKATQVVKELKREQAVNNIEILKAENFFKELFL